MADTLTAGRELDEHVAVEIFGWRRAVVSGDRSILMPPDDHPAHVNHWAATWDEHGRPHWLEPYSTDMSAAWQVAAKLRADSNLRLLLVDIRIGWRAQFFDMWGGEVVIAEAPEAATAICLAALNAVEKEDTP